jgi:FMN-dependent NADH-azoreductase
VNQWRKAHPGQPTETLELRSADLPELDSVVLSAREAVEAGESPAGNAAAAWSRLQELVQPLMAADRLVISAPMWNFGIPYRLKHFIDCVTQPTLTYRGSPAEGFEGLVPGTPAALILARGGSYPAGSEREAFDFQRRYLLAWLGFLGYRPVETILVEPTTLDPESVTRAETAARRLADRF